MAVDQQLRADDRLPAQPLGLQREADRAAQVAQVRQPDRAVAQLRRPGRQGVGRHRAIAEGECRVRTQLGVHRESGPARARRGGGSSCRLPPGPGWYAEWYAEIKPKATAEHGDNSEFSAGRRSDRPVGPMSAACQVGRTLRRKGPRGIPSPNPWNLDCESMLSPGSLPKHLPWIGLLLVSGLLLVLSVQHNRLERDYRNLAERNRFLIRGTYVPLTQATSLGGDRVAIGDSGRSEILIYLTTRCPYCAASVPAWRELAWRARRTNGVEVFIVSMDSAHATSDYLRRNGLEDLTTVLFLEPRLRTLFRSYSVPQTVVVQDGRVLYARRQVFSGAAADSVLMLLGSTGSTRISGRD